MRLLVVLVVGVVIGWVVGSLYPAPPAWVAKMNAGLHRTSGGGGQPQAAVSSPAYAYAAVAALPSAPSASTPPSAVAPEPSSSPAKPVTHERAIGSTDEQTLDQYRAWIAQARQEHPYADSEQRMYSVMMCESKGESGLVARSGGYSGLFQYSPSLWKSSWNTYRDQGILDAKAQIFATALAWHNHLQSQWGCYKHAS